MGGPGIARAPFISPDSSPVNQAKTGCSGRPDGRNKVMPRQARITDSPAQSWKLLADMTVTTQVPATVPTKAISTSGHIGLSGTTPQ